jgi:hypothetical protein
MNLPHCESLPGPLAVLFPYSFCLYRFFEFPFVTRKRREKTTANFVTPPQVQEKKGSLCSHSASTSRPMQQEEGEQTSSQALTIEFTPPIDVVDVVAKVNVSINLTLDPAILGDRPLVVLPPNYEPSSRTQEQIEIPDRSLFLAMKLLVDGKEVRPRLRAALGAQVFFVISCKATGRCQKGVRKGVVLPPSW